MTVGQLAFEQEVEARLLGRPHLLPVFDHPTKLPQRLYELNQAYYVVLNVVRLIEKADGLHFREWTMVPPGVTPRYNAWYEVRKLTAPLWLNAPLYIPYGALDARTILWVLQNDSEYHGPALIRRMEEHNAQVTAAKAREQANRIDSITSDLSWGRSVFGPGGPGRVGNLRPRSSPARRLYVAT